MKTLLKIFAAFLLLTVLAGAGAYSWASVTSGRSLERTFKVHTIDFAIPFPLTDEEIDAEGLTQEAADQVAWDRALERGNHLLAARVTCTECHGADLSGGVMIDAAPMGRLFGPNLTEGEGSRTIGFGPADWDRIVRHGVLSDGTPGIMPSEEFAGLSDQELSDIIVAIRARPSVDNEVPPRTFGPIGKVLLALGEIPLSADVIVEHAMEHVAEPPAAEATAEFGEHLASGCAGCHRADFAGGPIPGGDPSWLPAANITPHPDGIGAWSFEEFASAITVGTRPDGTALGAPMTVVLPYTSNMTDTELRALWAYLQTLPVAETGS